MNFYFCFALSQAYLFKYKLNTFCFEKPHLSSTLLASTLTEQEQEQEQEQKTQVMTEPPPLRMVPKKSLKN